MKLIFLDFDGVLNTPATWGNFTEGNGETAIDVDKVSRVNEIVGATGAKVVISSTWRRGRTVDDLQKLLLDRGAKFEVIGKTVETREERWKQIAAYLQWVKAKYIILDDMDEAGFGHGDAFIQTDAMTGITQANVERAIEHLK